MKLTDVLTATDTNPLYYKFVPIFIRAWKKLFPDVNIHIILICNFKFILFFFILFNYYLC